MIRPLRGVFDTRQTHGTKTRGSQKKIELEAQHYSSGPICGKAEILELKRRPGPSVALGREATSRRSILEGLCRSSVEAYTVGILWKRFATALPLLLLPLVRVSPIAYSPGPAAPACSPRRWRCSRASSPTNKGKKRDGPRITSDARVTRKV